MGRLGAVRVWVLVVLSGSEAERNQTAGYLLDLAFFFDRVRAVALPPGESLAGLAQTEFGTERLKEVVSGLTGSLPLADCAVRVKDAVARFTTTDDLQDDLTVLFIRRKS